HLVAVERVLAPFPGGRDIRGSVADLRAIQPEDVILPSGNPDGEPTAVDTPRDAERALTAELRLTRDAKRQVVRGIAEPHVGDAAVAGDVELLDAPDHFPDCHILLFPEPALIHRDEPNGPGREDERCRLERIA